jgi:hypothetical protein
MRNVTCCELISSWQQCIVVSLYTSPVFSAVLPHWHDVRQKTSKICTLPKNINSRVARSKSTDLAAMVMEERQVKYSELTDWHTAVSESWNSFVKQFYTHAPWRIILLCETWVWNWPCILTYTNWQHDFSAVCWGKQFDEWKSWKLFRILIWKMY